MVIFQPGVIKGTPTRHRSPYNKDSGKKNWARNVKCPIEGTRPMLVQIQQEITVSVRMISQMVLSLIW